MESADGWPQDDAFEHATVDLPQVYESPITNTAEPAEEKAIYGEVDADITMSSDALPGFTDTTHDTHVYSPHAEHEYGDDGYTSETRDEPDEDDMLPVEYARYHGLTVDYLNENPLLTTQLPSPPESLHDAFEDPLGALSIAEIAGPDALEDLFQEKWAVDKPAAEFLASIMKLGSDEPLANEDVAGSVLRWSDLKVDEAILHSDAEIDLSRLRRRNAVGISTAGMEPFHLNERKGEGLAWSQWELEAPQRMKDQMMNEKLEVDRNGMEYLQEILRPPPLDEEDRSLAALKSGAMVRLPQPITPPLLPLSPPLSPGGISMEVANMDLTSTPEDLIAKEAAALEQQIMAQDASPPFNDGLEPNRPHTISSSATTYSALQSPASSSSPLRRKRPQDLKLEVPLLPLSDTSEENPTKKAKKVSFPEVLHSLIPRPDSDDSIMDPEVAAQDLDAFIADVVTPLAESAIRQTENEQLVEVDTIIRVQVPPIEDVEIIPPWEVLTRGISGVSRLAAQKTLLSQTKRELLKNESTRSGVSKIERRLPWSPFPARLGKVNLEETFDDGSAARYMRELDFGDGGNDVRSLLWKPDGLRVLDGCESDDEDLEPARIDEHEPELDGGTMKRVGKQDAAPDSASADQSATTSNHDVGKADVPRPALSGMQMLLQKRKLELEAGNATMGSRPKPSARNIKQGTTGQTQAATGAEDTASNDLSNGHGLSSFMQLQGRREQRSRAPQAVDACGKQTSAPPAVMVAPRVEQPASQTPACAALPRPLLGDVNKPTSIIVSSAMLANRTFMRQIQSILPAIEVIGRDSLMPAAGEQSKPNMQSISQDADITISPSTGIVTTTLQKVKQKPLPGQSNYSGFRERITSAAMRYERLLVLVSEGAQLPDDGWSGTRILDDRDSESLSDLMGHVASIDANNEVYYVAGGEVEVVSWIAAFIVQTSSAEGVTLLHDETLWERFLREAGMNPVAAQCVLSALKQPDNIRESETSSASLASSTVAYGLAAFIEMSADERVQRFGPTMGGDKLLRRVSEVIEGAWKSA